MWYVTVVEWDLPRGYYGDYRPESHEWDMQDGEKVSRAFIGRTLEHSEYRAGQFSAALELDGLHPRGQYAGVTDKLLWLEAARG